MTVFVALADVIDNPDARAALEQTFSTVVVASAREHAVTELTTLGDTVDAAIIGVRERIDADVLVALPGSGCWARRLQARITSTW